MTLSAPSAIPNGKITLTAVPAAGYTFNNWSNAAGGTLSSTTTNPTTLTIGSGTPAPAVTANFTLIPTISTDKPTIEFPASGGSAQSFTITTNGTWSLARTGTAFYTITPTATSGTGTQLFTITPNDNTKTDPRTVTLTFTNGSAKTTVTLTQAGEATAKTYAASVARNNTSVGTVTVNGGAGPVQEKPGVGVTFEATVTNSDWNFTGWSHSTSTAPFGFATTANPLDVAMPAEALTMTANFTQKLHDISVINYNGSGATPGAMPDPDPAVAGTVIRLTAPVPNNNHRFKQWSLSGGLTLNGGGTTSSSRTIAVVMPAHDNGVATAYYEQLYTLSAGFSVGATGVTISKNPNKNYYADGESVIVSVSPIRTSTHMLVGWTLTNATRHNGSPLSGAVTGSITVGLNGNGNGSVTARYEPVQPGVEPYIIYVDGSGTNATLRLGGWHGDGKVHAYNIAYFKFGSTVAINKQYSSTDSFASGYVTFNPISATHTITGWATIPYYVSTHGDGNAGASSPYKAVTPESGYITTNNLKWGKGDPCRLIGLSAADAMDRARRGVLINYNSGWRLPTALENYQFVGVTPPIPGTPDIGDYWENSSRGYWTNGPSSGPVPLYGGYFPVSANSTVNTSGNFLPAAGAWSNGSFSNRNSNGYYWSSTAYNNNTGHLLSFSSGGVSPAASDAYAIATPVRCVSTQ